jgi:hypothetical protein
MTLGFVALCVFAFNDTGGDESLEQAYPKPSYGKTPDSAHGWLHMLEIVHVNIFAGMCLYFMLMFQIARAGKNTLIQLEAAENARIHDNVQMTQVLSCTSLVRTTSSDKYLMLRTYFIKQVLLWKVHHPDHWTAVLERLQIGGENANAEELVEQQLQRPFVFCKYTAYCIEDGICDCIEVAPATWLWSLVCVGILRLFAELVCEVALQHLVFAFGGMAIVMLVIAEVMMRRRVAGIVATLKISTTAEEEMWKRDSRNYCSKFFDTLHSSFCTEIVYVRTLQLIFLFLCYMVAEFFVGSFDGIDVWLDDTSFFIKGCFLLAMYLLFFCILPRDVPRFLLHMCLPPYVDKNNLTMLLDLLGLDRTVAEEMRKQSQDTLIFSSFSSGII